MFFWPLDLQRAGDDGADVAHLSHFAASLVVPPFTGSFGNASGGQLSLAGDARARLPRR